MLPRLTALLTIFAGSALLPGSLVLPGDPDFQGWVRAGDTRWAEGSLRPAALAPRKPKPAGKPAAPARARPATGGVPQTKKASGPPLHGPIDLASLMRTQPGAVKAAPPADGRLDLLFDGNRHSLVQATPAAGKPVSIQVVLDRPRALSAVNLEIPEGDTVRWSLEGASSLAELTGRRGRYRLLVPEREARGGALDQAPLQTAPEFRVYRLEARPASGSGPVRIAEWSLWAEQAMAEIDVEVFVPTAAAQGGLLQLRALARLDAGARQNVTRQTRWEITPPERGTVDDLSRFVGNQPGKATLVAHYANLRSKPVTIDVLPLEQAPPDWVVTHIERHPRVPEDGSGEGLKPGQLVYWLVHVKNYGVSDAGPVDAEWHWDGKLLGKGKLGKIDRFGQTEVLIRTKWDGQPHRLEFSVDPENAIAETSEVNNRLSIATDAVPVGFWVEDSQVSYHHRNQHRLGIGSNCWEDWAQRQILLWNQGGTLKPGDASTESTGAFSAPSAPKNAANASSRKYRLDRIVRVADGMLPLAGGSPLREPDRREKTVRLMFGFPARHPVTGSPYRPPFEKAEGNPFYLDRSLLSLLAGTG